MEITLIKLLADGQFHSGEFLGATLGVSRTAIWKQLQKLEALGVVVEATKGLGYRIPGGIEFLDKTILLSGIADDVNKKLTRLEVHQVIDSTNAYVSSLGEGGHGVICLAERQTGGRGRRGRAWLSPFARNIYFSLGWTFQAGSTGVEGLSLAMGVAVKRALQQGGAAEEIKLKWPNDLIYKGRKLGGVLIELHGEPTGPCQVVVGVGVNLGMPARLAAEIDQPWADAREVCSLSRNQLARRLIEELLPAIEEFAAHGLSPFLQEWAESDICRERQVQLHMPGQIITGVAKGIADNGAILIDVNGDIHSHTSGEVSLRLTP